MIVRTHESTVKTTLVAVRDKLGGSPDCCRNRSIEYGEGVAGTMVLPGVDGRGVVTAAVAAGVRSLAGVG